MQKRLFLVWLLLGAAFMLGACRYCPGGITEPAPEPTSAPSALAAHRLTYLYFSESSSYFKRVQGVEFCAEDDRYTANFYMANEEEPYPVAVDPAWVETLEAFITAYDMMAWDGFSESDPDVLDGTHFFVEFAFDDGTKVMASGYGEFPGGYSGAAAAIDAHFLQLLPEDMRDW